MISTEKELRELGDRIVRELHALPAKHLFDDATVELMLNPDGSVWVEKQGLEPTHIHDMSALDAKKLFGSIAHSFGKIVNEVNPILEGALLPLRERNAADAKVLYNCRFEGLHPPVVDAPAFAIRKRATKVFDLPSYVNSGALQSAHYQLLREACANHQNILVIGGTGSGKTTFTNAILKEISLISPDDRIISLEDTAELQIEGKNNASLYTTKTVDMRDLLKATMRLRPDRIVVGEVRGGEALDLLKAWNTGHSGGVCTLHANSATAGLTRLEQLCAEAGAYNQRTLIGEAVHYAVFISKTIKGRKIEEVVKIHGYDPIKQAYETEFL